MTLNYLEIFDRSRSGQALEKDQWDMERIVLPVRRLVKDYWMDWDSRQVIPENGDMVDRIFQAGMELAVSAGIFCLPTDRVIAFSLAEIEETMRHAPRTLQMGEGQDARQLFARGIMDERLPLVWAGNPGAPTPEELFLPSVLSWVQEPIVDLATCGCLTQVDGRVIESGNLMEIHAARQELRLLREALRNVGRPGMGLLAGQSAGTEVGDLAITHPDYLRSVDAHLVTLFNELMIDRVNMSRAYNSVGYGMRNASLATVMVGGLGATRRARRLCRWLHSCWRTWSAGRITTSCIPSISAMSPPARALCCGCNLRLHRLSPETRPASSWAISTRRAAR